MVADRSDGGDGDGDLGGARSALLPRRVLGGKRAVNNEAASAHSVCGTHSSKGERRQGWEQGEEGGGQRLKDAKTWAGYRRLWW